MEHLACLLAALVSVGIAIFAISKVVKVEFDVVEFLKYRDKKRADRKKPLAVGPDYELIAKLTGKSVSDLKRSKNANPERP